jgi:hypothetical protein
VRVSLLSIVITIAPNLFAHAPHIFKLQKVVESSDLVVVATVQANLETNSGSAKISGSVIPTVERRANLQVCRWLKGESPTAIDVGYTLLRPTAGWGGGAPDGYGLLDTMDPNTTRLVFLRNGDSRYQFTDVVAQSIELGPDACKFPMESDDEPFHSVTATLISVLHSSASTETKERVLQHLRVIDSAEVLPELHQFLSTTQDQTLRIASICSILAHKDPSVLGLATQEMFSSDTPWGYKVLLIEFVGSNIEPTRSIPILTRALKLSSPQVRTAAVRALYTTGSSLAIEPLLSVLDDPDHDVQFAVMEGLGWVTKQYDWRPHGNDIDEWWLACVHHWQQFRNTYTLSAGNSDGR